jgi:cell division protein FtsB
MQILALVAMVALLFWIGLSANSIVVNSAIAATEAQNLRVALAGLTERAEDLKTRVDQLEHATDGLRDVITLAAYWFSQRPEFFDLEPDYLAEKEMTKDELHRRSHARVALSLLSNR